MDTYRLAPHEATQLTAVTAELATKFATAEDPRFLRDASWYASQLPLPLRRCVHDFRCNEPVAGTLLISGIPVDQQRIGATPSDWRESVGSPSTLREDLMMIMLTSTLGEVVGWRTQQSGRLIHDVFPIQRHEHEQLGTGSAELLTLHTEDAFHEFRGDYVVLFCLRNPDDVATNVSSLDGIKLTPEHTELLFQPLYSIRPDHSHQGLTEIGDCNQSDDSVRQVMQREQQPAKIAVLFGDPASPYLRLDPYFMDRPSDPHASQALSELVSQLERNAEPVVAHPGDLLIVDNYRALHGRRPFGARYDGTDRWLRRINLVRDLRKSISSRESRSSRVIH